MIIEIDPDLESVLFEEFDAQYCRRRGDARFNADSDEAEVRAYLGTYFLRSWAEHTLIWKRLLTHKTIQASLQSQECIRILDVGSGTGGHLYAVVEQLRTKIKKSRIKVLAIDANEQALHKQSKLHERKMFNGVEIDYKLMRFDLDSDRFGQQLQEACQNSEVNFDIVLSSKFLSEIGAYAQKEGLNSRGFYQRLLDVADQVLSPHGIVSLVDVNIPIKSYTLKNDSFTLLAGHTKETEGLTLTYRYRIVNSEYKIYEEGKKQYSLKTTNLDEESKKPFTFPFEKYFGVTQWYGYTEYQKPHTGIDFGVTKENTIAVADGEIVSKGWNTYNGECNSGGNYIIVKQNNGMYTGYFHLDKIFVNTGDDVKQGSILARTGNTGFWNCQKLGYHLHFVTRKTRDSNSHVNPVKYIEGDWNQIPTLGYKTYPGRLTGENPHPGS